MVNGYGNATVQQGQHGGRTRRTVYMLRRFNQVRMTGRCVAVVARATDCRIARDAERSCVRASVCNYTPPLYKTETSTPPPQATPHGARSILRQPITPSVIAARRRKWCIDYRHYAKTRITECVMHREPARAAARLVLDLCLSVCLASNHAAIICHCALSDNSPATATEGRATVVRPGLSNARFACDSASERTSEENELLLSDQRVTDTGHWNRVTKNDQEETSAVYSAIIFIFISYSP